MFDECDTVWDLTRRLCEELDAQVGGVGCIVSRVIGDVLVQIAEHADNGRTFQLGRGFLVSQFPTTARVLEDGNPQAVSLDDEAPDPAEADVLRDLAVRAVLMLALRGDSGSWGLVELYRVDPGTYGDDEIARAQEIVDDAGERLRRLLG
jgi:GAF domain